MWVASQTRPNITNAVSVAARHSRDPREIYWKAAQKIPACLRATAHLRLQFHAELDGVVKNVRVYA